MANSDQRKKGKCEELAVELSIAWIEEAVSPEICYKPSENKHSMAVSGLETLDDPASISQSASQSSKSTNIRCRRRYSLEFKK